MLARLGRSGPRQRRGRRVPKRRGPERPTAGQAKQETTPSSSRPRFIRPTSTRKHPLSARMRPKTRSTNAALGPAVTRLPPNVLSLIFSHHADFNQVSGCTPPFT